MTSLAASQSRAESDCIVERSVFEDRSALLSFEQVQNQIYSPLGAMLTKGYSDSAFWIKIKLDPTKCYEEKSEPTRKENLILRIQPPYLDEIQIFDPLDKTGKSRITGDRYSWNNDEYKSLNFNFQIPYGQSREIWLRLKTTSTAMMRIQALSPNSNASVDKTQELGFGIYIGLLGLIFLGALISWWLARDFLSGIFAINQISSFTHSMVIMGYYRVFMSSILPPRLIDISSSVIILTFAFITTIFQYSFYRQFGNKRWASFIFLGVMFLYPLNLCLMIFGNIRLALNINLIGLWSLSFFLLVLPFFAINWKQLPSPMLSKKTLLMIYFVSNLIAWVNIFPALGFFTANPFAPYFGLLYGLLTGFIFLALLQRRYRQGQIQNLIELNKAKAVADFEYKKRIEQSEFLQMLSHEIKTSLSVIKISYASERSFKKFKGYVDNAVTDINEVVERVLLADQLDSSQIDLRIVTVDLNNLIDELIVVDKFKVISSHQVYLETDINLLRRIMSNLIENALKYGAVGSPVEIQISCAKKGITEEVTIAIRNKVGVVGAPDPERVFQKYYRSPKAYEKTGSGLGLFLVKKLAELLEGGIRYKQAEDWIVFELILPR
jgi:signal transduction histidine kinase